MFHSHFSNYKIEMYKANFMLAKKSYHKEELISFSAYSILYIV